MPRILFRLLYGALLVAAFLFTAWLSFRASIVGRSVTVPDLAGKTFPEAIRIAHDVGLRVEEQASRARYDDRVPRHRVLLQQPEAGSLAKPGQVVRLVLSLGPRELQVPDLAGLAPRAAALKLARESLQLGAVSWYRDAEASTGIVAQSPEPETPATKGSAVEVLTNRGMPELRFVMPDFVGQDADRVRARLETFGFRVGSARYETYEGVAPNTVLKQFPPAGYPLSRRDVVSLTVSQSASAIPPAS
ncbi:MAG TPA: PASTA domain-containing protein [Thermoanaerobaculia bacterium]